MKTVNKLPEPTGDIWTPDSQNPATVPIATKLVKTHIQGPFRERERKLWTFLIQAVWDDLKNEGHQLPLKKIGKVFRELGWDHNVSWLKDYVRSIAQTTVEFEAEDGTAKVWKISNLISDAEIVWGKGENSGQEFIQFSIPRTIKKVLHERRQFTRLRPHLVLTLSGKYTVTLYELLESVANQKYPVFKAPVEHLRDWLAVPEGKLTNWYDFQKRAIKPAVKELNDKSEDTGFTVSYELVRGPRRKVEAVHFRVEKVASRLDFERRIKKPEVQKNASSLPRFTPREYEILKKSLKTVPLDIYELEADWRREFESQAHTIKTPIGHFTNYTKRRVKAEANKSQSRGLFSSLFGKISGN